MAPLAASFGDLLSLITLAGVAMALKDCGNLETLSTS
jgi:hypothetical protein